MNTTIQTGVVALSLPLRVSQVTVVAQERNLGELDGGVTVIVDQPADTL